VDLPDSKRNQRNEGLRDGQRRFRRLHETMFGANIAAAFGYALLVYVSRNQASMPPADDSTYYFLLGAFRINDLLRLRPIRTVSTSAVARQFPSRSSQLGEELVVLVSVLGATAFLFLLLRLLGRTSIYRAILNRVAFATALFAAPACYLFVSKVTWNWLREPISPVRSPFWQSLPALVFAAEILCLCAYMVLYGKRASFTWLTIEFLIFHYAFWTRVLLPEIRISLYPLYTPYMLLTVFPLSTFVWLRYGERLLGRPEETNGGGEVGKTTWVLGIAAIAALSAIWSPSRAHGLAHPRDLNSLTVQLSRGPCYGSCPSYTITIHGDGLVEYIGQRYSRIRGQKTGSISREQVIDLLRILDRVHFMSLEDRAFCWGFDSPSVGILVSVDGSTKRVVSDTGFVGAKTGHQAHFVGAADEIDKIVGSTQWVDCDGPCWN
jgi:hypothetical protein